MNAKPICILLVEDDDDDRLILEEMLEEATVDRYELTWCTDIHEVEDLLSSDPPPQIDIALIDFHLSTHTGLDVLEMLRSLELTFPCVMLTGRADTDSDRDALQLGAIDYLVKGQADAAAIERTIRYAINHERALRNLRDSEARFRSLVESATDGIILLDEKGYILTQNRAASMILGMRDGEIVGRNVREIMPREVFLELAAQIDSQAEPTVEQTDQLQRLAIPAIGVELLHADGSTVPVELTVGSWMAEGRRFWSVIARDITERRKMSDRLSHQAYHDPLTGLANRLRLKERLAAEMRRAGEQGPWPGLIFLDVDNFKLVNDTFGHEIGDEFLISVARRLVRSVRGDDLVVRLGGDEFAILLERVPSPDRAAEVAARCLASLEEPVELGSIPVRATVSAGVAIADRSGMTPADLLRDADVAMYAAKAAGKARFALFEDEMHRAVRERLNLEQDLRKALDAGHIGVAYQPIVRLSDRRITGFEALARWNHPTRGAVSPEQFVQIAEDAGMIEQLGRQVLSRAVGDAAEIQQRTGVDFGLNVNLSILQLADAGLVDSTRTALQVSGLRPGTLTLEVTESVMVGHVERAISVLNELKDLRVRLALDDFGTGYSSLSYLHTLPLDSLKSDRSFVNRCAQPAGAALLRATVAIARSLELRTVAEGIETHEEFVAIRNLGFNFGQGYLFSKPVSLAELSELAEANRVAL